MPLISLEVKKSHLKIEKHHDFKKIVYGSIPLECYYFNNKLNFYEPLVEKTKVEFEIQTDKFKNKTIDVKVKNILNLNFSVAVYDTIFNVQATLKEEKTFYEARKNNKID